MNKKRFTIIVCLGAILLGACVCGTTPIAYQTNWTPLPPSGPSSNLGTPTPEILTCQAIENAHGSLTDLQWASYTREIIGKAITFTGQVLEVYGDGRVQINGCGSNLFTVTMLYGISEDVALSLNKDQYVQGTGTIKEISYLIGVNIQINVDTFQK